MIVDWDEVVVAYLKVSTYLSSIIELRINSTGPIRILDIPHKKQE
jgi:hypothetical protein